MIDGGNGMDAGAALDALFRANAARDPDGLALIDPPDIEAVTGKPPQRLSFAELDARIALLARLLREIGIADGSTVAIQLPNNADSVIALLAVARARLVPALLPLLWRRAECVAALARAHAKAILCCGRVGDVDHGQLALEIAAELFPIRAVCGFGSGLADGIVPIDAIATSAAPVDDIGFPPETAAITFDIGADGPTPFEHDALQLFTAGLLIAGHAGIERGCRLLSTLPISTCAGLSGVVAPWLIGGGPLELHHPFSSEILSRQIATNDVLVVPDAVAYRLQEAGRLATNLRGVISLCRSPERLASATIWTEPEIPLVDVAAFGEFALLAAKRPADGKSAPWPLCIRSCDGENEIARLYVTASGTLGIDGALATRSETSADTDTGYPARPDKNGIVITAAPAGTANVGGYRFAMRDLQHAIRMIEGGGLLAALPHSVTGHRLAGNADDPGAMRRTLGELGLSPLVSGAFRDRSSV